MESYELPRIITFSGRKESGKSALSVVCVRYGYTKISFATPLKNLICNLQEYDSVDTLNKHKNIPLEKELDVNKLSQLTGIPIDFCIDNTKSINKSSTGRDWLQIIGTDLIRKYDNDWHVKRTIEMMDKDTKYVCDDVRFPNELEAMRRLGAVSWFVIRPKTDNISNHPSEISLSMGNFPNHIIVNDGTLEYLQGRMEEYISRHTEFMKERNLYLTIAYPTKNESQRMKDVFLPYYSPDYTGKIVKIIPNETHDGVIVIREVKDPYGVEWYKSKL